MKNMNLCLAFLMLGAATSAVCMERTGTDAVVAEGNEPMERDMPKNEKITYQNWSASTDFKYSMPFLRRFVHNGKVSELKLAGYVREIHQNLPAYKGAQTEDFNRLNRQRNFGWAAFKKSSWGVAKLFGSVFCGYGVHGFWKAASQAKIDGERGAGFVLGGALAIPTVWLGWIGTRKVLKNYSTTKVQARSESHKEDNAGVGTYLNQVPELARFYDGKEDAEVQ